jgi:ribose transport system permease protein
VYVEDPAFGKLGSTDEILGLRYSAWILLIVVVIMTFVLIRTVFGLHVSAMGANSRAAQLIGVRIRLVRTATFVIVGGLAGLAGMISSSQLSSATANVGGSLPLDAIAAVVIGGTSLAGGRGSVARTFVGVLILGVLTNVFDSFGWNSSVQLVVKGAVILAAVGLDALRRTES